MWPPNTGWKQCLASATLQAWSTTTPRVQRANPGEAGGLKASALNGSLCCSPTRVPGEEQRHCQPRPHPDAGGFQKSASSPDVPRLADSQQAEQQQSHLDTQELCAGAADRQYLLPPKLDQSIIVLLIHHSSIFIVSIRNRFSGHIWPFSNTLIRV